ncbi:MAG: hypothetical protein ACJ77Z_02965 [Thermoleophilaceae bacterium]
MPPVKGMTAGERAERNARIAASYCAGESWASLAERAGVSVRHAKRIVVRDRAQRPLSDDPFDRAVALAGLDEFDAHADDRRRQERAGAPATARRGERPAASADGAVRPDGRHGRAAAARGRAVTTVAGVELAAMGPVAARLTAASARAWRSIPRQKRRSATRTHALLGATAGRLLRLVLRRVRELVRVLDELRCATVRVPDLDPMAPQ